MKNKLICGDNLEVLSKMESESVDLIYIDPPFFSNRQYNIIWNDEAEIKSFEDRWEGGINVYIDWMRHRVMELHRVLKPTGSIYIHLDWHACHYMKVMIDDVFGYNNFRNEIAWCYRQGGRSDKCFSKKHDNIFFYTKSNKWTFNADSIRVPYEGGGGYQTSGKGVLNKKSGKVYKPNEKGKIPEDWWDIPALPPMDKERLGYPTQKPEALLERIIKASSNEGDVICDCFCGCGTALAVSEKLGRQWVGVDISPSAISLVKNRILNIKQLNRPDFDIIGMPTTTQELKKFKPYDFQYYIIQELHGTPNKKSGDMGVDGYTFLEHCPIQVKRSERVGRQVLDNFQTAIKRHYDYKNEKMRGYIVAFSFTKGCFEEVARARKQGIYIELVTVQDILNKKFSYGLRKEKQGDLF